MTGATGIGAMRARLQLQAPVDSIDETGAIARSWTTVAGVWAQLKPRAASGEFVAGEEGSIVTWDVFIRWRADVAAPMRFRIGGRTLAIRAAFDPELARRILVCRCEEMSS